MPLYINCSKYLNSKFNYQVKFKQNIEVDKFKFNDLVAIWLNNKDNPEIHNNNS